MIKLERVCKTYKPDLTVLKDIHLTINKGEFIAIMGQSGSGKSTLINIIGCLDTPTSGKYWLDEEDVSRLKDKELAGIRNKKIGFVFQSFNLLPRLSALRNVEMPLLYASICRKERKDRARGLLAQVGLQDRVHHAPAKLSGGEQQRVAIARALSNQPEIIIADEPTGNLDTKTGKEIMEYLSRLNNRGITVIVITHDLQVASYARRTIKLCDGKIVN